MLYNLIGDIHGCNTWQKLVRKDAVNIFLGDYLDPYDGEGINSGTDDYENLLEIIRYKQTYPDTILLLGNHDLHYLWHEHYSRYNPIHANRYAQLFRTYRHLFQAAYAIGDNILVTHAGVTRPWCALAGIADCQSATTIAESICQLMDDEQRCRFFMVDYTFDADDYCGTSATASPIWVRPQTLVKYGSLMDDEQKNIIQVVGHTQVQEVMSIFPYYFVDCLRCNAQSLLINLTDDGQLIPSVNIV